MNEVCKQRIKDNLLESLKKEGLPTNTAEALLKINPPFLSMVKNRALWYNVSEAVWEVLLSWVNSGKGIEDYAKNGVHIIPQSVTKEEGKRVIDITKEKLAEIKKGDIQDANTIIAEMSGIVSKEVIPDDKDDYSTRVRKELIEGTWPNDQKYSINLAEIGWIIGLYKKGKPVEKIAKELKVYVEIVKIIIENCKTITSETPAQKLNISDLMCLLNEEKANLVAKLNAIDILLNHYNE